MLQSELGLPESHILFFDIFCAILWLSLYSDIETFNFLFEYTVAFLFLRLQEYIFFIFEVFIAIAVLNLVMINF